MKCEEIMTRAFELCAEDEAADEIVRRMRSASVSFFAVCDRAGAIVGALSPRDLPMNLVADGDAHAGARVSSVMTNDLVCCGPEDDLEVARDLMSRFGKTRVVCVDGALRPVGVITGIEMLRAVLSGSAERSRRNYVF